MSRTSTSLAITWLVPEPCDDLGEEREPVAPLVGDQDAQAGHRRRQGP
jgi:hypothetical protein